MSIRPQAPVTCLRRRKLPITELAEMKVRRQPIVMVTAYDAPVAGWPTRPARTLVLVGDSAAMTMLGHDSTVPATIEEMLMLTRAVTRGARRPRDRGHAVRDVPGLGRGRRPERDSLREGGGSRCREARGSRADAACSGDRGRRHSRDGPHRADAAVGDARQVQGSGRSAEKALALLADAALDATGCFALVLEAVPAPVAARITREISIPTIGIGAGAECDGQVLVWHDLLGLYGASARFVKRYAEIGDAIRDALSAFERTSASAASRRSSTRTRCRRTRLALFAAATSDQREHADDRG